MKDIIKYAVFCGLIALTGCEPSEQVSDNEFGVKEQAATATDRYRLKVWAMNTTQNSFGENAIRSDLRKGFDWICSSSRQYKPDLILMSENNQTGGYHNMTEVLNELKARCGSNYATTTLSVRGGTAMIYNTNRFSLSNQTAYGQYILRDGACVWSSIDAMNVFARFHDKLRGQYLNAAAVHNDRGSNPECAVSNEKQLRDDLYIYSNSGGQFYTAIIGGDFNAADTDQWWFNMVGSPYNDAIYDAGPPTEPRHTLSDGRRVDFIFVRNGSFENANTVQPNATIPAFSDHALVTTSIILP